MTRSEAIGRIKKCLALSGSSNEHEAAAALGDSIDARIERLHRDTRVLSRALYDCAEIDDADERKAHIAATFESLTRTSREPRAKSPNSSNYPSLVTTPVRKTKIQARDENALAAGFCAGDRQQLHRPMGRGHEQKRIKQG